MWDFLLDGLAQAGPLVQRSLNWSFAGYPLVAFVSLVATSFVVLRQQRQARGKRLTFRLFGRTFFSKGMVFGRSGRVDIALFVLSLSIFPVLFGWMMLSGEIFLRPTHIVLDALFGHHAPLEISPETRAVLSTLGLFLAYEFGYWLDHYLSHRIAFLWHFHKVHHTATSLSVATVHRVHPIDTVVFAAILAVTGGVAAGCLAWIFGAPLDLMEIAGTNLFLYVAMLIYVPLQHSGVWLAFTGVLGRVFLSPAHHQMHHANDPTLYGSNLGSCLALFDWMFGTLKLPDARPQKLTFGVSDSDHPPHGIVGHVVTPFCDAAQMLVPAHSAEPPAPAPLAKM